MRLVVTLVLLVLLFEEDAAVPANDPETRCESVLGLCGHTTINIFSIISRFLEKITSSNKAHASSTPTACTTLQTDVTNPKGILEKPTVSPLACFTQSSPLILLVKEKCNGIYDTGSAIGNTERNQIPSFVNEYRAMVNNNCTFGLGVPKPAANYRKVKYSCALEMESQFDCSSDLTPETFTSDEHTWRSWGQNQNPKYRQAIFQRWSPWAHQLFINPDLSTVENNDKNAVFMKLFLSEDVTEVGCYVKVCGGHEYIACKTNHDQRVPKSAPLYTPGQRCNADADCTLPGYTTCDTSVGLCDFMFREQRKTEALLSACQNVRNVYIDQKAEQCDPIEPNYGSISNNERAIIVHVVNHHRKLINNKCDLGKGHVQPITNYRKVKYSCALERDAGMEFSCLNVNPDSFKSGRYTLRFVRKARSTFRTAIFVAGAPWNDDLLIHSNNQTTDATENNRNYMRFMLAPEVTEIGCFVKVCGEHEYMACKSGHAVIAPKKKPLYTPGNRCIIDKDCTLPDYTQCDAVSGLCETP